MEYENPARGLPDANIPNNPFWSGVNQSSREQNMLPFLRNANVQSDVETQTAQQKWADMMSPEQRALRAAEINKGTVQNTQEAQTLPFTEQLKRDEAGSKSRLLPHEEAVKLEQYKQDLAKVQGKPVHDFLEFTSNAAEDISKLPPPLQAQAYTQLKDQWKQMNPGIPLPPKFEQFTPDVVPMLKGVASAFANDPKLRGQKVIQGMKEEGDTARNAATNAANIRIANIRESGDDRRAARLAEEGNIPRQMYNLRSVLQNPASKPEEKDRADQLLYQYINTEVDNLAAKDESLKAMTLGILNPATKDKTIAEIDQYKTRLLLDRLGRNGVRATLSDLKKAYPGQSDSKLKEAYKKAFGKDVRE